MDVPGRKGVVFGAVHFKIPWACEAPRASCSNAGLGSGGLGWDARAAGPRTTLSRPECTQPRLTGLVENGS